MVIGFRPMSRKYRAPRKGGFYHVTNRGNNKEVLYRSRGDMQFFIKYLARACVRSNVKVHAYCLMSNHYHVLLETPEANLSYAVMQFESAFACFVNKKYERVGHVFQGRFDSQLIEEQIYYLTVVRYIMQNPVRAMMIGHPRWYEFCSYRMTMGFEPVAEWFARDYLLNAFEKQGAKNGLDGKQEFVRFINERDYENLWHRIKHGAFLGSDEFVRTHLPKKIPKSLPKALARAPQITLRDLKNSYPDRNQFIAAAHMEAGHSQASIARYLGVHPSTVCVVLRKFNTGERGA
ncbi:hypothetical protein CWE12_08465 [Aliidiomarina sedimenti]|uniref:Transposase IS200-like domain-containing protein n=2 Tax=Aliidiomarina sedimenti TaxID=1933879 RepID=A0ABY0BZB2_9GAMM|nr:hypothetical protein CWE12_08465 [Aliidiomarina sedimenti]